MDYILFGEVLTVVGKVMVVLAVLHMHSTLVKEHKIDRKVILSFQQERVLTWSGLLCIVAGFVLQVLG